ncbi:MAG: hypothetical protein ACREDR_05060 [Blastocatellia bacterium]
MIEVAVVTSTSGPSQAYKLWDKASGWESEEVTYGGIIISPRSFRTEESGSLLLFREEDSNPDTLAGSILQLAKNCKDKLCVAAHNKTYLKVQAQADYDKIVPVQLLHDTDDPVFKALQSFVSEPSKKGLEAIKHGIVNASEQNAVRQVAAVRHAVARLLVPVTIDLKGWRDSDFDGRYGSEIISDYRGGRAQELITECYRSIYVNEPSIRRIVEQSLSSAKRVQDSAAANDIEKGWAVIQQKIPRNTRPGEPPEVYALLTDLGSEEGLSKLKNAVRRIDGFIKWYSELDEALAQLRPGVECALKLTKS